jgi:hypothetical protein
VRCFLREGLLRAFLVEFGAPQNEFSDPRGAFLNERAHGLAQTEPVACLDGVFEMDRYFVFV